MCIRDRIDKDTQLERFNERQNTPEKQWKITEEDWRNREKWDQYETAVNEMITKTSTTYAPWHILESVDKKYARIKALRIVIEEMCIRDSAYSAPMMTSVAYQCVVLRVPDGTDVPKAKQTLLDRCV